jgi:hypothetical protein
MMLACVACDLLDYDDYDDYDDDVVVVVDAFVVERVFGPSAHMTVVSLVANNF